MWHPHAVDFTRCEPFGVADTALAEGHDVLQFAAGLLVLEDGTVTAGRDLLGRALVCHDTRKVRPLDFGGPARAEAPADSADPAAQQEVLGHAGRVERVAAVDAAVAGAAGEALDAAGEGAAAQRRCPGGA